MVLFGESLGLTQCRDKQRLVLGSLNHFANQVHTGKPTGLATECDS